LARQLLVLGGQEAVTQLQAACAESFAEVLGLGELPHQLWVGLPGRAAVCGRVVGLVAGPDGFGEPALALRGELARSQQFVQLRSERLDIGRIRLRIAYGHRARPDLSKEDRPTGLRTQRLVAILALLYGGHVTGASPNLFEMGMRVAGVVRESGGTRGFRPKPVRLVPVAPGVSNFPFRSGS